MESSRQTDILCWNDGKQHAACAGMVESSTQTDAVMTRRLISCSHSVRSVALDASLASRRPHPQIGKIILGIVLKAKIRIGL